jgi:hypothetical protein
MAAVTPSAAINRTAMTCLRLIGTALMLLNNERLISFVLTTV